MTLPKTYDPRRYEQEIYAAWKKSGAFKPSFKKGTRSFCVLMPPPNANADLHIGHALYAVQDIPTRYHRMRGENVLYLPGADHAGFETQVVFERQLAKEGKSRFDFDRASFYKAVWKFVQKNKATMENQLRRLGMSADWTREKFTLDPDIVAAVYATFKKLYQSGLVYRGDRIVNFCTYHGTSFSDLEVEYEERGASLWHIGYPIEGGGEIVVATTRPETMLGDTAVAVHPADRRYKKLVGRMVKLPFSGRLIPIVADAAVKRQFGTGAVKVTPAHDTLDFEIGERNALPRIQIIGSDGKITNEAPKPYRGLTVLKAREKVIADLTKHGLLKQTIPYHHSVGVCYKCRTVIEPLVRPQWFLKMQPLAVPAVRAVKRGETKFLPKRFEKLYFNWLNNIKDWNISRQLWWGIPIPVLYCNVCEEILVYSAKKPKTCSRGHRDLREDPDTFDTWFSSGQWPFATLGFPRGRDFKTFYPTTMLATAYEIIFFWVARMMMLGLYRTGRVPFRTVYIHGLIRDRSGNKISKSRGNVINPLEMVETYGADALRLALVAGISPGTDMRVDEARIQGARNFVNKLWNVARFVLDQSPPTGARREPHTLADEWILSRLEATKMTVTAQLDRYDFGNAADTLRQFVWAELADWYLEAYKAAPNPGVLSFVFSETLKLLHPFLPFVSEVIWSFLALEKQKLILTPWPKARPRHRSRLAERRFAELQALIRAIRDEVGAQNIRGAKVKVSGPRWVETELGLMRQLSSVGEVEFLPGKAYRGASGPFTYLISGAKAQLFHVKHSKTKERGELMTFIRKQKALLAKKSFVTRAPRAVVEKEREKLAEAEERLAALQKQ